MTKIDSTGAAVVDPDYFWLPIESCPLYVKVQLLSKDGVAIYGSLMNRDPFFTHWAPLPKLRRE